MQPVSQFLFKEFIPENQLLTACKTLFLQIMEPRFKDTIMKMNDWGKNGIPFFFMIDYRLETAHAFTEGELDEQRILVAMPGFRNVSDKDVNRDFYFKKNPVDYSRYESAFDRVMEAINRGDTFLLNLTFPTQVETNLTLHQIFTAGKAKFRLKYKDQFVVFSPEQFVAIRENIISSFPMKGTIDVSVKDAENKLLTDVKEVSEHNTIVDLIRNDLSMVAKKVRVKRFRYIERVKTHEKDLLQTSSEIAGELPPDWRNRVGDLLVKLLPAGSISGAPKQKTMEIISEAEGYERDWFTGIFGHFDGRNLESAVMIRFIEQIGENLVFKSGGGITHFSNCRQEYEEMVGKVYLPF